MRSVSYRDILRKALTTRIQRNPKYSLRAFARDLSLRSSHLSLVLNEKNGISLSVAERVADELELDGTERNYFCDSVVSLHSRDSASRKAAKARLKNYRIQQRYARLAPDHFACIADWYHFAILELIEIESFAQDEQVIASALGIPLRVAQEAIERLLRLGLLARRSGRWVDCRKFLTTDSDVTSQASKSFHDQTLRLAQKAIWEQDIASREFFSMTMSIQKSQMPMAKREIRRFVRSLNQKLSASKKMDSVYSLSVQFFDLLKHEPKEEGSSQCH